MCKINELEIGKIKRLDTALVVRIEQKKTRTGKYYCLLTLRGADFVEIAAKIWDSKAEDLKVNPMSCISAEISCEEYQGEKCYVIQSYAAADEDPKKFEKKAPGNPEKMFGYIMKQTESLPDDLKKVTQYILEQNKEKFIYSHGSMLVHHAYRSGLIYHTVKMLYAAESLIKIYNVDADIVKAGIILHDIGKVRELCEDKFGIADYTVEGKLFGHSLIGVRMVDEACIACEVPRTERIKVLQSSIASHLMEPERGTIVPPSTKEAFIVAMLSMLDARLDIYDLELAGVEPGKFSNDAARHLFDTGVYKIGNLDDYEDEAGEISKEEAENTISILGAHQS